MKSRYLIESFIYAMVAISNLVALQSKDSTVGILVTTGAMLLCAACSAHSLHLYITQPKDKK